jgi:D-alanyl-lipoteichoic acid acyltransferase DltB (MBOAT superfamily)
VVLADSIAPYADVIFRAAAEGGKPTLIEAWIGVLAYAFQIYFDFSGYSDMAIGLARMFGIHLPLNFHSPYKAMSIIEFWRRWHISLSRFLRDYLYIPLGGNRRGGARQLTNLMITMVLGGLWHGAGWTFVMWGALHGLYLVTNHVWRILRARFGVSTLGWLGGPLTFIAVCIAWVYFRAENLAAAHTVLQAMFGKFDIVISADLVQGWPSLARLLTFLGVTLGTPLLMPDHMGMFVLAACAAIVWLAPNSQQIIGRFGNAIDTYHHLNHDSPRLVQWRPTHAWGVACALALAACFLTFDRPSRFLYFQF